MARANSWSINRLVLVLALALPLSACATSAALKAGRNAEQLEEYDRAIVEYTKVLRQHPEDRDVRRALDRAKLRSSQDHFTRGRRFHNGGRLDEAVVELQLAAELNPGSREIEEELTTVRTELKNKIASQRAELGKTGDAINHLKLECNLLKMEIDGIRSQALPSSQAPSLQPSTSTPGPMFLPLEPDEREEFSNLSRGSLQIAEGAFSELNSVLDLRAVLKSKSQ